ncbi:hypothetical protein LCGC14_1478480 [marine sediment metagenome]|uniref:Uncharacterized protein n=1 Tax=marine sediment metagenome TaxID=412755 RepID=A0A0F9JW65_9ZZZZ
MKVDLELLRDAREARQAETISEDKAELLGKAEISWRNHPVFCDKCGETDPENGFYSTLSFQGSSGSLFMGKTSRSDSLSGILCNDCDKQMRTR